MIFIASTIPMYLVGSAHSNKDRSKRLLERAVTDGEVLVTDAEVLQEILHRYVAIDRRQAIPDALDALLGVVDEVFPIERPDVLQAAAVLDEARLSAGDALHTAVMRRRGISRIMTFDRGFDGIAGIVTVTD